MDKWQAITMIVSHAHHTRGKQGVEYVRRILEGEPAETVIAEQQFIEEELDENAMHHPLVEPINVAG